MNDYQWLAIPVLAVLAIVGGALVGWALHAFQRRRITFNAYSLGMEHGRSFRDNPDPSDSAGA